MYKIVKKKFIVNENSPIALIDSIVCYCMSGHWECSHLIWNENPNPQNSMDVGKSDRDSHKIYNCILLFLYLEIMSLPLISMPLDLDVYASSPI